MNQLRKEPTEIYAIGLTEYGKADIDFEDIGDYEELSSEEYSEREKEITELENKIFELIEEKFEEFHKRICEDYEYLMSDEAISEHLEINEYEFGEDGARY